MQAFHLSTPIIPSEVPCCCNSGWNQVSFLFSSKNAPWCNFNRPPQELLWCSRWYHHLDITNLSLSKPPFPCLDLSLVERTISLMLTLFRIIGLHLNFICKLLQRVLNCKWKHLQTLLLPFQSAYRKFHSTGTYFSALNWTRAVLSNACCSSVEHFVKYVYESRLSRKSSGAQFYWSISLANYFSFHSFTPITREFYNQVQIWMS